MKKQLARSFVLALLVLSLLAGCGPAEPAPTEPTTAPSPVQSDGTGGDEPYVVPTNESYRPPYPVEDSPYPDAE